MPVNFSHHLDLYNGKRLLSGIGLFEPGAPDDATAPEEFVMRVNRHIFLRTLRANSRSRLDLAAAILPNGRLGRHAELVVFGTWLVQDGMQGSKKRSGKAPNVRRLFKVVASAFAALVSPKRSLEGEVTKRRCIGTKDIVELFNICFEEATRTADHSSALRSLRRILPEYLDHLKGGHLQFNRVTVTASPQMVKLARAIRLPPSTCGTKSGTTTATPVRGLASAVVLLPSPFPAVSVSPPTTFEIPLRYASPDAEAEYRNVAAPAPRVPHLGYVIHPVVATSEKHRVRADRVGRVVFKPDHDVTAMVKIEALIDRICFALSTKRVVSHSFLQKELSNAGVTVYVFDRTFTAKDPWQRCLPELDLSKLTGQHFAVMLQDPTPGNLREVLEIIDTMAGIDGEVRPCLLELAVDFNPRDPGDPVEALLTRERIVGLLQRHHWSAGEGFLKHGPSKDRYVDPRQLYRENGKQHTRYLFADASKRLKSDSQLQDAEVRHRLLSRKSGNELHLNATIYRGELTGPRRTNVQHKVSDQRNTAKGTSKILDNDKRRARIEMTLTSLEALEEAGLKTIVDLADYNFRHMSRKMLGFRLPTCEANSTAIQEAISQMQTRGVYGVEMSQRARAHEQRELQRPKPRKTDRDGAGLTDWPEMSEMVGAALDRLKRKWRGF